MLWLSLALAGCVEYRLDRGDDRDPPPEDDSDTVVVNTCAGLNVAPARTVELLDECASSPSAADPWDVVIEWQYFRDFGGLPLPVVGNLTDDNADGLVDERDDPEIVFGSTYAVSVLRGEGGGEVFSVAIQPPGLVIADVDGDGFPDVTATSMDQYASAWDGSGAAVWQTRTLSDVWKYAYPAVADLEGDGVAEVVADRAVVSGGDGAVVVVLEEPGPEWRAPLLADLDLDGLSEIVLGDLVFDHVGNRLWRAPISGRGALSAVVNGDTDDHGELIFVSGSEYVLMDADGTVLVQAQIAGLDPGPPCVADFDGDGGPEVGIAAKSALSVLELDGSALWSRAIYDPSGIAGCSAVDLDVDGAAELLYADHEDFRIFDGRTGAVRFTLPEHYSITGMDYPVVADVDHDGSAEIILSSSVGDWRGITVLGHRDGGWPRVPTIWPVHDYAVTNVRADGSVPTRPEASWLVHNTFRAQPTLDEPARSELRIALTDICVSACDGEVHVSWQVANVGAIASPTGVRVTLYAISDGAERALASTEIPSLSSGEAPEGQAFIVSANEIGGALLAVEVENPDGCYDKPHRVTRLEPVCP